MRFSCSYSKIGVLSTVILLQTLTASAVPPQPTWQSASSSTPEQTAEEIRQRRTAAYRIWRAYKGYQDRKELREIAHKAMRLVSELSKKEFEGEDGPKQRELSELIRNHPRAFLRSFFTSDLLEEVRDHLQNATFTLLSCYLESTAEQELGQVFPGTLEGRKRLNRYRARVQQAKERLKLRALSQDEANRFVDSLLNDGAYLEAQATLNNDEIEFIVMQHSGAFGVGQPDYSFLESLETRQNRQEEGKQFRLVLTPEVLDVLEKWLAKKPGGHTGLHRHREIQIRKTEAGQIQIQLMQWENGTRGTVLEVVAPTFSQALDQAFQPVLAHRKLKRLASLPDDQRLNQAVDEAFYKLDPSTIANIMQDCRFFDRVRSESGELMNYDQLELAIARAYVRYCVQVARGRPAKMGPGKSESQAEQPAGSSNGASSSSSSAHSVP